LPRSSRSRRPHASRAGWVLRLPLIALLVTAAGCAEPVAPEALRAKLGEIEQPNLVLVLVDTLRADWTTPYGFQTDGAVTETTPELARWAREGAVFERALSQSSWTKISMASLFTSLWPVRHGIFLATDGLSKEAITLPKLLRQHGYSTYGVQSNGWLEQSFGFHHGFDHYVFPRSPGAEQISKSSLWPHGENVLEEAERLFEAHDASRPFFLYLHFMDVHEYAAPPEFKTFGGGRRGSYLAAIRWTDDLLKRLRRRLERDGVADRTIVVFASDHAETFGENQSYGHAVNVFSKVLHVPLIIRFPFVTALPPVRTQVRNVDIAPTLLDLAGIPAPPVFDGRSLLPLLESPGSEGDRESYASLGPPIMNNALVQTALNDGSWTMAKTTDGSDQEHLYDRELDPEENANLIDLELEKAAEMRARLDAHLASETRQEVIESDVRIAPEISERLKALGYLD